MQRPGGAESAVTPGEKFGHWQVLGADATGKRIACKCVCGVVRIVGIAALRNGACTSCGCQKPTSDQRKRPATTDTSKCCSPISAGSREIQMAEITTITTDGVTIVKFTDRIAEIIIDPTSSKAITADMLVRVLTMHGVFAAKIINQSRQRANRQSISPTTRRKLSDDKT